MTPRGAVPAALECERPDPVNGANPIRGGPQLCGRRVLDVVLNLREPLTGRPHMVKGHEEPIKVGAFRDELVGVRSEVAGGFVDGVHTVSGAHH